MDASAGSSRSLERVHWSLGTRIRHHGEHSQKWCRAVMVLARLKGSFRVLWLPAVCMALPLCTACAGNSQPDASKPSATAQVEAQAFRDVVEYIYMIPGPGQLRAIRVSNFVQDQYLSACGKGSPIPLADTSGRLMQQLFPDLELIRTKGLVEDDPKGENSAESGHCSLTSDPMAQIAPSLQDASALNDSWTAEAQQIQRGARFQSLRGPMRKCMQSRSSLKVGKNVPDAYLDAVNLAMSGRGTNADLAHYSKIYADCSKRYFGRLARVLSAKRTGEVKRHSDTLKRLAAELTNAGYTP